MILLPWEESDAPVLFRYASEPEIGIRAGWAPHKSMEDSLEVIRTVFNNDRTWAMHLKETGEIIGCMGYMVKGESNVEIAQDEAEAGYCMALSVFPCGSTMRLFSMWNPWIPPLLSMLI